jgi:glycine C-acetyltransferase
MYQNTKERLTKELEEIQEAGLFKEERIIQGPQGAKIRVPQGEVLNFCANNYLGLSNNEQLKKAASKGIEDYGFGLSSVRFICGTQNIHKDLEAKVSSFLQTEDTILYTSCFDANGGLFETLLGAEDAVISDSLNHASIIDGVRLCKAKRFRYEHNNMEDLERCLKESSGQRTRMIATDGVFSMDGDVAPLQKICDLADQYEALVMVDDSHATGFFGPTGRGSIEYCGVMGRIDIVTSTLGKALGGASGGFTSGKKEIVAMLRQRSRPYLFSNSLPPALVCAGVACLDLLSSTTELRDQLEHNTQWFRENIQKVGFKIRPGDHPIVPIMLGDARVATAMADKLLEEGIYVIGFSFPVVPKGKARIRVQISAAHTETQLKNAISAFAKVGNAMGILGN